jgi:hypothetical protein
MPRAKQPLLVGVGGTLAPLEELRALEPASLFQIRICAAPWKRKEIKSSAFGGPGKESNWRAGFFLFERNERERRERVEKKNILFISLFASDELALARRSMDRDLFMWLARKTRG